MRTGLFRQEVKSQEAVCSCIPACHFLAPPLPWGRGPSEGQVLRKGEQDSPLQWTLARHLLSPKISALQLLGQLPAVSPPPRTAADTC